MKKYRQLGELPDFTPSSFYVPGERHENLPVNRFAGFGTPVQSLWADKRPPEYATGGSGMFQGADFGSGYGKLIALHGPRRRHMGQDDSTDDSGTSLADLLSQGLSTAQAVAQAATPQAQAQAVRAAAAPASASSSIMSKKLAGIPVVVLIPALAVAGYFIYKKVKK